MQFWLPLDKSASYQIRVQGYVSPRLADRLGLSIAEVDEPDQTVTTLSGRIVDQAALLGILNSLYGMGFSLLSVEYQSLAE
jgi:hypothetical protein